jgi:hypothetical protein
MAKYSVVHACGHKRNVTLYGDEKDREQKLARMAFKDCPKCVKEKRLAAIMSDDEPLTITIKSSTTPLLAYKMFLTAHATGGTYKERKSLTALGFQYAVPSLSSGLLNYLAVKHPIKTWHKTIDIETADLENKETLNKACGVVDNKMGGFNVVYDISESEFEDLRKSCRIKELDRRRIEKIGKSPLCEWVENVSPSGKWNGKIYGNKLYGFKVYINGAETVAPKEIVERENAWQKRREQIDDEFNKVVKGW